MVLYILLACGKHIKRKHLECTQYFVYSVHFQKFGLLLLLLRSINGNRRKRER